MALVMCPLCTDDENVHLVKNLPDGRKRVECRRCNYEWDHGVAREPENARTLSAVELRGRLPKVDDLEPAARERADRLKAEFLATVRREPDPRVAPFWSKYQRIFSAKGLPTADPVDLKAFANDPTGVYVGFMTGFNVHVAAVGGRYLPPKSKREDARCPCWTPA